MRALITVDAPAAVDPQLAGVLASLYGLTSTEAETVALLAGSRAPAELAAVRGVELTTVRSRIKSALRKTDAGGLARLIVLAATMPRHDSPGT